MGTQGEVTCEARLELYVNRPENISKALNADNTNLPPNLSIKCWPIDENRLECDVTITSCKDPSKLLTLRNTLEDILLNVMAADGTLRLLKRTR